MTTNGKPGLIGELPLHGRRLIEASAGTGKTYTLAGLYLRLVLGVDCKRRTPPEILVLTFTNAATRELRDRIRKRLVEAARVFRTGTPDDDLLAWLLEKFESKEHPAQARLLDVAASWMDEAAIFTIHSWCQTALRQHAFDSGSLFEQELDQSSRDFLTEAVEDYWRDHVVIDHAEADQLVSRLESPGKLRGILVDLLKSEVEIRMGGKRVDEELPPKRALDRWRESTACRAEERRQIIEPVRVAWKENHADIEKIISDAKAAKQLNNRKLTSPKWDECRSILRQWVTEEDASVPSETLQIFRASRLKELTAPGQSAPQHAWFNQVEKALQQIAALGPEPDWLPDVQVHAATDVRRRLEAAKLRHNVMDFDDLIVNLDRAVSGSSGARLRENLIAEFPVAMVDEFQDTDSVQYRIFDRIWGTCDEGYESHSLLLIGDPKQSIYGFRGADVHAYMQARESVDSRHTLGRNFRATKHMVSAANAFFSAGEQHPEGAFAFSSSDSGRAMPFEEVEAQGRSEELWIDGGVASALTLWYAPASEGKESLSKTDYQKIMAGQAAERVAQLLNLAASGRAGFQSGNECQAEEMWRPIAPSDIAVLVPGKKEASLVRAELRRRSLSSVYLSARDSIFDSDEASELLQVLAALAEPGNERLLRAGLASRLLARTTSELDSLNRDEQRLEQEFERFRMLQMLWQGKGVLAMMRRLLDDYELPARILADPSRGERALTNLLHLTELLQVESQSIQGEHALIRWLDGQVASAGVGDAADEQILRLESDAGLIRVVTSHSSKGLEYPLVFAPFVCSYKEHKKPYVRFHDDDRQVVDLQPDEKEKNQARLERRQEALRLFYVTVTRARHACWLGLGPVLSGASKRPPDLEAFAPGHLLLGLADDPENPPPMRDLITRLVERDPKEIDVVDIEDDLGCTVAEVDYSRDLGRAREYKGASRPPWWIASYSALKVAAGSSTDTDVPAPQNASEAQALEEVEMLPASVEEERAARPAPAVGRHAFPRGARPGTFLHGLLEWAGIEGMKKTLDAPDTWLEQIERRCHRRGWDRWTEVVQAWMLELLRQPMWIEERDVRLCDLQHGHYVPELEFWFEASGVNTVALDRVVREGTLGGARRAPLQHNILNGMMRGFIDLVFEHEGRYYVLDYKSNHLGEGPEAYSTNAMRASVLEKRYDLQFAIYTLALHRLLKSRLPNYDYDTHVGGAVYLYLRGCGSESGGVFHERPDRSLIEALDQQFLGRSSSNAPDRETADVS